MTHLIDTYGLALMFVVIALESGGLPLPGETSLVGSEDGGDVLDRSAWQEALLDWETWGGERRVFVQACASRSVLGLLRLQFRELAAQLLIVLFQKGDLQIDLAGKQAFQFDDAAHRVAGHPVPRSR